MVEKFSRWDVVDHLKTDEDIAGYFDACIEEDPGDGSLIRAALNDICRAQGITKLAKETGMSRDGLYGALSPDGNPEFKTILKVVRALGLTFHAGRRAPQGPASV
jgi:probable addiction module antidote protein